MRRDVLVLGYHSVSTTWEAPLAVTPQRLDEHLSILTQRGYRGATFLEAVTAPPWPLTVAVTFDDAFNSVLVQGLPILASYRMPATVFVPTAFPDSGRLSWPGIEEWVGTEHEIELEPMGWNDLGGLADMGWEIGSHTRNHPHLTEIADADLDEELRDSRAEIETALGRPCSTLAYPYGDHDDRVVAAAGRAGYTAATTLPIRLGGSSLLRWPRVGVYQQDDARRFRHKVSRGGRWLRSSRAWEAIGRARGAHATRRMQH